MVKTLGWLTAAALAAGLVMAFGVAPREVTQGNVQRIMYVHVPLILASYVAFVVLAVASLVYLVRRDPAADGVAHASGEVGVMFVGLGIATGSIWGKPTWGTWWTWDARLTSVAILFVMYLGYLLLRGTIDDPERAEQHDHEQARQRAAEIDVEEHDEETEHERLDDEHERQVAGELAEIDGGLVSRCQQQPFPAVVLALDEERSPEREQRAEDEAEPQHARQDCREPLAVAAERELEHEQQEQREEDEGVERLLRAPLDGKILPRHGQRAPRVAHADSSACAA